MLQERPRVEIRTAIRLAIQVLDALAHAHTKGMVHRDIKPANVILTPKGEVKLLDFGIAKLPGQTALTRTGTTVGTVAYMAPEQIAGHGADERTDTWALGVVLYEMLAGGLPFGGGNELAIMRAIADTEPRPLRTVRGRASPTSGRSSSQGCSSRARRRSSSSSRFATQARRVPRS